MWVVGRQITMGERVGSSRGRHRLMEIVLRWEIETQRSEATGMTSCEQSHRVVRTELRLEPTISVHVVTNWLKQRTRENANLVPRLFCHVSAQCQVLELYHLRPKKTAAASLMEIAPV